jgi:hypothetical protein
MDYGKAGSRMTQKKAPRRHAEHNAPGSAQNPFGARPGKDALLARMKAAAGRPDAAGAGDRAPPAGPKGGSDAET